MNTLHPLYNKTQISFKKANESFQYSDKWDFAIKVGYCDLQFFLSTLGNIARIPISAFAYTASDTCGWRCDYFNIPDEIILKVREYQKGYKDIRGYCSTSNYILATGYSTPSKLKRPNYKKVRELDKYCEELREKFHQDLKENPDEELSLRQQYTDILLTKFNELIKDAHNGKK